MRYIISGSLLIGAFIHLLPISGIFGARSLAKLYGVAVADANVEILLRHRAVLFGLLGAFLVAAAFDRSIEMPAFIAGIASTASFLVLARLVGNYSSQLSRVVLADIVALMALVIGAGAHVLSAGA